MTASSHESKGVGVWSRTVGDGDDISIDTECRVVYGAYIEWDTGLDEGCTGSDEGYTYQMNESSRG